ncbi:MAG TPA: NUDIX domain-containing protein [Vicinamibacteria bacterium]|nr:NUDIX domain-containing protein [Vicinamibacteria bacterium]
MPRTSAGLLMFRRRGAGAEVLLVHPGGPFWAGKDEGAWSIPKGELDDGEGELAAARREFEEETGFRPEGVCVPLGSVRQRSGKIVHAWAIEGDWDPATLRSNTVRVQWPPRSGRWRTVPEFDRAEWFDLAEARRRINPAQAALLDVLERQLSRCS